MWALLGGWVGGWVYVSKGGMHGCVSQGKVLRTFQQPNLPACDGFIISSAVAIIVIVTTISTRAAASLHPLLSSPHPVVNQTLTPKTTPHHRLASCPRCVIPMWCCSWGCASHHQQSSQSTAPSGHSMTYSKRCEIMFDLTQRKLALSAATACAGNPLLLSMAPAVCVSLHSHTPLLPLLTPKPSLL